MLVIEMGRNSVLRGASKAQILGAVYATMQRVADYTPPRYAAVSLPEVPTVRSLHRTALVYAAAFISASCGGGGESASDELLRDLSAAQSSSIELAARIQDYQPTRFVSTEEQIPVAAPTRARAPRRVYNPPAVAEVPLEETTISPEPAAEIVQSPMPAPEQTLRMSRLCPAWFRVLPRLRLRRRRLVTPMRRSDGPGRGEVLGTIIGEAIGVVIRGGPVAWDIARLDAVARAASSCGSRSCRPSLGAKRQRRGTKKGRDL